MGIITPFFEPRWRGGRGPSPCSGHRWLCAAGATARLAGTCTVLRATSREVGGSIQPSAAGTRLPARSAPRRRGRCRSVAEAHRLAGLAGQQGPVEVVAVVPVEVHGECEKPEPRRAFAAIRVCPVELRVESPVGLRAPRRSCDIHTREFSAWSARPAPPHPVMPNSSGRLVPPTRSAALPPYYLAPSPSYKAM